MGRRVMQTGCAVLPLCLLAAASIGSAAAQTPGAFAGKTVTMYIGFGPGGGYDMWARVVAAHIGKHLPGNPTVTPAELAGRRQLSRRRLSSTMWRRRTAPRSP